MKITLISLITLSVGLFVGHFWGVGTEQARTRAQLTDTKSSSDRPLGGAEEEETRTARTEDEGNAQGLSLIHI